MLWVLVCFLVPTKSTLTTYLTALLHYCSKTQIRNSGWFWYVFLYLNTYVVENPSTYAKICKGRNQTFSKNVLQSGFFEHTPWLDWWICPGTLFLNTLKSHLLTPVPDVEPDFLKRLAKSTLTCTFQGFLFQRIPGQTMACGPHFTLSSMCEPNHEDKIKWLYCYFRINAVVWNL